MRFAKSSIATVVLSACIPVLQTSAIAQSSKTTPTVPVEIVAPKPVPISGDVTVTQMPALQLSGTVNVRNPLGTNNFPQPLIVITESADERLGKTPMHIRLDPDGAPPFFPPGTRFFVEHISATIGFLAATSNPADADGMGVLVRVGVSDSAAPGLGTPYHVIPVSRIGSSLTFAGSQPIRLTLDSTNQRLDSTLTLYAAPSGVPVTVTLKEVTVSGYLLQLNLIQ